MTGLIVGAVVARLPLGAARLSELATENQEYLIVNGWVLTREDIATMDLPADVIRLQ